MKNKAISSDARLSIAESEHLDLIASELKGKILFPKLLESAKKRLVNGNAEKLVNFLNKNNI